MTCPTTTLSPTQPTRAVPSGPTCMKVRQAAGSCSVTGAIHSTTIRVRAVVSASEQELVIHTDVFDGVLRHLAALFA